MKAQTLVTLALVVLVVDVLVTVISTGIGNPKL